MAMPFRFPETAPKQTPLAPLSTFDIVRQQMGGAATVVMRPGFKDQSILHHFPGEVARPRPGEHERRFSRRRSATKGPCSAAIASQFNLADFAFVPSLGVWA
jgi:hypothetical protein